MIIVEVAFLDWNGEERNVTVTSEMHPGLTLSRSEEETMCAAIQYIKRRYTECMSINGVEIIAD
jgi:hypothetical protein